MHTIPLLILSATTIGLLPHATAKSCTLEGKSHMTECLGLKLGVDRYLGLLSLALAKNDKSFTVTVLNNCCKETDSKNVNVVHYIIDFDGIVSQRAANDNRCDFTFDMTVGVPITSNCQLKA